MSYIYDSMRPFQRTGAHFMRRAGSALLTDQPGLGKTIQALGTIIAKAAQEGPSEGGPRWHLIVCPKVAIRNVWEPETRRWLTDHPIETLSLTGSLDERQQALAEFAPKPGTEHVFVIVNIESMRIKPEPEPDTPKARQRRDVIRFKMKPKGAPAPIKMWYAPENGVVPGLLDRTWDTVVCDESHRALIRTSGIATQTRAGFVLVQSRRRLALSGTPMRGKPEQLWGTLNWLRPDLYRSYWNWVKRYFALESNGFSNYIVGGLTASGKSRLADDLSSIMLRRTKAEVVPELPAKTYAGAHLLEGDENSPLGIWLEMTPAQRKQYDRLVVEGVIGDQTIDHTIVQYTRQRQVAGALHDANVKPTLDSPKFEWLVEWLEENDGEKVVVVSQFTSLIDVFARGLREKGFKVETLTGRTSDKKREQIVRQFQETDETQVFMLNVKAGGVALTLDAADYLVFLDETAVPDDQEQAEDRIHRVSRVHNVTIYYLRTLDTIEEEVAYIAAARQDVQQYLLDGARGVEFARQVYLQERRKTA